MEEAGIGFISRNKRDGAGMRRARNGEKENPKGLTPFPGTSSLKSNYCIGNSNSGFSLEINDFI
jgi:hypothetical protein